jgi:hypothetical protein
MGRGRGRTDALCDMPFPPRKTRRAVAGVIAGLAAMGALAAPASAAEAPVVCPDEHLMQPYVLYLDTGWYFIAPGGHFEGASTPWETAGGAALQARARINDYGGAQVMRLPAGGSATSPPVCIDVTRPHMRLDVRAHALLSRLRVDAVREDGSVVPLRTMTATTDALAWGVSPKVPLTGPLGIAGDDAEYVRLRVTAVSGTWAVDDVAVDPYKR